jgi:hypothetical protein
MIIAASTPVWLSVVAPVLAFVATLIALALTGRVETLRLRSQHRSEEQRKLRALIGEYHGRLLEATVDWDRRMSQMYDSRERLEVAGEATPGTISKLEEYVEDEPGYGHYDPVIRIYGKFCKRDEYFFRSFAYRLVSLCVLARQFESEAFFIDSQVARPADFQFLKYAKSFLWAMTTADLPYKEAFPSWDHIPSDYLRPVLDSCYHPLDASPQASAGY